MGWKLSLSCLLWEHIWTNYHNFWNLINLKIWIKTSVSSLLILHENFRPCNKIIHINKGRKRLLFPWYLKVENYINQKKTREYYTVSKNSWRDFRICYISNISVEYIESVGSPMILAFPKIFPLFINTQISKDCGLKRLIPTPDQTIWVQLKLIIMTTVIQVWLTWAQRKKTKINLIILQRLLVILTWNKIMWSIKTISLNELIHLR